MAETNQQIAAIRARLEAIARIAHADGVDSDIALSVSTGTEVITVTWGELLSLLADNKQLRQGLEAFTDWMNYWPPRSGEIHCKWCGNRFWVGEDGIPLEDIDNAHDEDCPFIIARHVLNQNSL